MWSYNFIMNNYSMLKHEMPYRFLLYILSVSSSQNAFTECFCYRLESGSEHSNGPYLRDAKLFKKKLLEDINPIRKVEITRMLCNLLQVISYAYLTQMAEGSNNPTKQSGINGIPYLSIHKINLY
jgi:hypothetical protein